MADWPSVNFDWLANLPARMDEARINQVRQSLGNIDLNSPKALSNAASRLAAAGDLESAQKFFQLSSQRMTAEAAILSAKQRGLDVQLWEKYMQGKGAGGAAPAETTADVSIGPPKAPAPPPGPSWLPSVSPNPPGPSPGPRSDLPPGILPPNPSEEILAKAEGQGPQAPMPGPQLAGPPPGPPAPAGPPMMPSTPGVGFLSPQQGVPQLGPPPAAASPRAGMPIKPSDQLEGQATEVRVGKELMQMPPRSAGWPAFQMFKQKFTNALAQQKLSPEESAYQQDQVQRAYLDQGSPAPKGPQTRREWADENKTRETVFGAAHKVYTGLEDTNSKSTELLGTLRRLDQIRKDPNFIQGTSAHDYASFMSGIASLASIAGVPLTTGENVGAFRARVNKIAEPWLKSAALVEEFDALSKKALQAHVGSFAKSFSEGDRLFTEKYFPQIIASPGGLEAVIGDLRLMAEHAQGVASTARSYMSRNEPGSKATEWGLRQAIADYNDKNILYADPNGNLTPAGARLLTKAEGGPQGGPPASGPPRHPQAGFIVKDKQGKPVGTIDDSGTFVPSSGRGL